MNDLDYFVSNMKQVAEAIEPVVHKLSWDMIAKDEGCICECGYDKFYIVKHTNGGVSYQMECVKCNTKYPLQ